MKFNIRDEFSDDIKALRRNFLLCPTFVVMTALPAEEPVNFSFSI